MTKKTIIGSLAVLAIAGCLFSLLRKPMEKGEQLATEVSKALGQRVAEEVANLLGDKGQIAVFSLEIAPDQNPTFAAQMKVFNQTLKKHGVKIAAVQTMPGGVNMLMLGQRLSPKDYGELIEQAPSADIIVSFVGPPNLNLDDLQKLQAHSPRLIVVDTFDVMKGTALPALVEAKVVALAVVPRTSLEIENEKLQPKLFDRYYKILRVP